MQKKLIVFSLVVLLFILFPSNANSQTATNAASRLKEQIQLLKDQEQTAVSQIKKGKRVELGQQIKETVQAKKEAVKEAVATKKGEFKVKLQAIKDRKKKALVERIDTKLANINTKHTDRFTQVISNLQLLLDKISQDVDITEAQVAIDTAQAAVANQAAKTYIITISTEIALRSDVGTVVSQLRQDLKATHKLVVDAKQAVQTLRENNAIIKKEATSPANL